MNQEAEYVREEYRREIRLVGRRGRKEVWLRSEIEELRSGSEEEVKE